MSLRPVYARPWYNFLGVTYFSKNFFGISFTPTHAQIWPLNEEEESPQICCNLTTQYRHQKKRNHPLQASKS